MLVVLCALQGPEASYEALMTGHKLRRFHKKLMWWFMLAKSGGALVHGAPHHARVSKNLRPRVDFIEFGTQWMLPDKMASDKELMTSNLAA